MHRRRNKYVRCWIQIKAKYTNETGVTLCWCDREQPPEHGSALWDVIESGHDLNKAVKLAESIRTLPVGGIDLESALWDMQPSLIAAVMLGMNTECFLITHFVDILLELIEKTKLRDWVVLPSGDYRVDQVWCPVCYAVADENMINVDVYDIPEKSAVHKCLEYSWFGSIYATWNKYKKYNSSIKGKSFVVNKPLFLSYSNYWTVSEDREIYDSMIQPLIDELKNHGLDYAYGIEVLDTLQGVSLDYVDQRNDVYWLPLWSRVKPSDWCYGILSHYKMLKLFQMLHRSCNAATNVLMWRGVSLYKACFSGLRRELLDKCPLYLILQPVIGDLIEQMQPSFITATSEYSPVQKLFLMNAYRMGVPAYGLQHGALYADTDTYMMKRVSTRIEKNTIFIPQKTFLWGEAYKRILVEDGDYPEKALSAIGNWRYDKVLREKPKLRAEFQSKYNPKGKRLVLLCSSGRDFMSYVAPIMHELLNTEGVELLIKLHHYDDPQQLWEEMDKNDISRAMHYTGSIMDALVGSDLLISPQSSVLGEAALLKLPSIFINFERVSTKENLFYNSRICQQATSLQELLALMERYKNDEQTLLSLKNAQEQYVKKYYYSDDGLAAKRFADMVLS